jgi:HEAT repeat protein
MINFHTLIAKTGSKDGARAKFEEMLAQLVRLSRPGVRRVEANPGDWGIDVFVGQLDGLISVWQSKFFIDGVGEVQQQQIRESLTSLMESARAQGFSVDTWTLCIPCSMDAQATRWWEGWKKRNESKYGITIELWDETELRNLLLHPDAGALRDTYFGLGPTPSVSLTLRSLGEACAKVTSGFSHEIIAGQRLIVRRKFRRELDNFLGASIRYGFVIGPSGVGKSAALAVEAERLLDEDWAVLLLPTLPGNLFSFEYAAELISQHIQDGSVTLRWHQIVQPLAQAGAAPAPKFAIFIDAIDEANPDHISRQLSLLHQSIVDVPPDRLKILMSCRDLQWESFMRNDLLPLYVKATGAGGRAVRRGYEVFPIGDFTPEELDAALEAIDDKNLMVLTRDGKHADSHVLTLRDLLKHPATFEHYADLRLRGDIRAESLTWSQLIESRLQVSLLDAERHCQRPASELREDLIELAVLGRAQSARDYSVEVESVKEKLPGLFTSRDGAKSSPYEALIGCGILLETSGPESKRIVGFRIADAGSYFLSFALEGRAADDDDAFREMVAEWLSEAWNYSPLLDALLAWVDRLSDRPRSPRLLLLLESILHSHRGESLFGLMQPAVLGSLFEMLKRGNKDEVWRVRDAAVEVRPSPSIWPVVDRHLRDLMPEARRLAVELVALHRHEEFTPNLVELLGDEDEDVRREVFVGFGRLGRPSIPFLLRALEDRARPTELRERYLWALANVGYRDSSVSEGIGRCLEEEADHGLLQSALLLAAHLRDRSQKGHAIAALTHENYRVVQAGVKYLKEAPAPEAFDALRDKLRLQRTEGGDIVKRHSLPRQLMTAILETDPAAGELVVLGLIRDGISGVGDLNAVNAAEAADRYGIAAAYPLVLERVVADLTGLPEKNILWRTSEILGKAWKWEELESLAAAARKLQSDGIDIARLFVDAVASNLPEHEEFPMGDRLNRVKDLHAVIKARAENFVPEACRLLPVAPALSSAELCRFFWVAADSRAEEALLDKLGTPLNENGREWYAQNLVVSALSTCGTRRGGQAVLAYTHSGQRISYYFHQEALHPLLVRGIIQPDELAGIIDDSTASAGGRTASLLALASLSAEKYKEVFLRRTSDDEDDLVQLYAVRLLGFVKDGSVITPLRQLLRASSKIGIKAQAAEALGWLGARDAVPDIEDALEDAEAATDNQLSGFLKALASFRERTSLELILEKLKTAQLESRQQYLKALGAFSYDPRGEGAVREQFEEFASGYGDILDEQGSLFSGLIQHAPNIVLENVSTQYDRGRLSVGGRQEIANSIVRFFRDESANKALLMETAKRLVCDFDVAIRERAMHALRYTSPAFCQQLYDELWAASDADEWKRACAVQTLGFWDSDLSEIESARFGEELLVRRAADEALQNRQRRQDLQKHLEQFRGSDGLGRLCSYLCLKKQGDLSTIWALNESISNDTLAYTYVRHLSHEIRERLRKDYQERQREQEKRAKSRGTIYFD